MYYKILVYMWRDKYTSFTTMYIFSFIWFHLYKVWKCPNLTLYKALVRKIDLIGTIGVISKQFPLHIKITGGKNRDSKSAYVNYFVIKTSKFLFYT